MLYRIFPLGDSALTVDFGNVISPTINDRVRQLAAVLTRDTFAWLIEVVPAYSSLTIFYDTVRVRRAFGEFETAFAAVHNEAEKALAQMSDLTLNEPEKPPVRIPVCYDPEFALDLEFVAEKNQLAGEEIIRMHTAPFYRVFMIGFLPGFPYLGETDERLEIGRKSATRPVVPPGSVGIAGRQTGIYSLASPGGWQIIGRTPLALFNPQSNCPTLLQAGDLVQFYEIDRQNFAEFAHRNH